MGLGGLYTPLSFILFVPLVIAFKLMRYSALLLCCRCGHEFEPDKVAVQVLTEAGAQAVMAETRAEAVMAEAPPQEVAVQASIEAPAEAVMAEEGNEAVMAE